MNKRTCPSCKSERCGNHAACERKAKAAREAAREAEQQEKKQRVMSVFRLVYDMSAFRLVYDDTVKRVEAILGRQLNLVEMLHVADAAILLHLENEKVSVDDVMGVLHIEKGK